MERSAVSWVMRAALSAALLFVGCVEASSPSDDADAPAIAPDGKVCPATPTAGCPCDQPGQDLCLGVGSGLSCGKVWMPFSDGPCNPALPSALNDTCFSPTQNVSEARKAGALGCACVSSSPGQGVCVGEIDFVCTGGHWTVAAEPCVHSVVLPSASP